jgi:hypothetical protein
LPFTVPDFQLGYPDVFSFDSFDPPIPDRAIVSIGTALPWNGISLDSPNRQLVYNGSGVDASASGFILSSVPTAEADWKLRSGQDSANPQPGVVWYHDFRSDAEVTNFRCSNNSGQGAGAPGGWNDPLGRDQRSQYCRRITTDGITGACMEILRPAIAMSRIDGGTSYEAPHWIRQFSPLNGASNGRGVADPGAGGTITPRSFTPTQNGSQTSGWSGGWYANSVYHNLPNGDYDGTEYWIQCRVKMDQRRLGNGNTEETGKALWVTRANASATDQEVIIESGGRNGGGPTNYFGMYRSIGPNLEDDAPGIAVHGNHPGTQYGTVGDGLCRLDNNGGRLANCWYWPPDQWVTVLWHIRPGTNANTFVYSNSNTAAGNSDTLIEVYVAAQGVQNYTRIWYQPNADIPFDVHWGHQVLYLSTYCNEEPPTGTLPNPFYIRFCQLIFSKQYIPVPQV